MTITIRDKHTGVEKDLGELCELHTDTNFIYIVIKSKEGGEKPYFFDKIDYEIAYIF